jgi:(p)ppGpp synthase/HD superfamily hydrolase
MPDYDHKQVVLGTRFEQAFELANRLHAGQTRKTSSVPYIAHLLGVAALVIEDGGSEDEAVAALLHDAAEDQGGEATLAMIKDQFGARVARIVADSSDTLKTNLAGAQGSRHGPPSPCRTGHLPGDACRQTLQRPHLAQ